MKISYGSDADVMYIKLKEGEVAKTVATEEKKPEKAKEKK